MLSGKMKKTLIAHKLAVAFGASVMIGIACSPAYGQSNATGTIFGQVPVAENTTVVFQNVDTGVQRTVTPDSNGKYQATSMPPGRYKVTLMHGKVEEDAVEVEALVGSGVEASFAAKKDASVQTVVVSSHAHKIDVSNTNNGAIFTAKELENLPIGQDLGAIISLAPGTNTSQNYAAPSFGGAGASENSYYINGFPVVNALSGVGYSELPFGAIQNAQILEGGYGAEFGRSTGGVANITTKSGTNNWVVGGEIEYAPDYLRTAPKNTYYANTGANPLTDGKLYQYNQRNTTETKTVAIYAGGPLIKDKLFVFAALQEAQTDSTSVGGTSANPVSSNGYLVNKVKTPRYLVKLDYNITDDHHLEFTKIHDANEINTKTYGYDYSSLTHNQVLGSSVSTYNCCENNGQGSNPGADDNIFKYTGYLTNNLTVTALYGKSTTEHLDSPTGYNPNLFQTSSGPATRVPGLTYINPQTTTGNFSTPDRFDGDATLRLDVEYKLGAHSLRGGLDQNRLSSVYGVSTAGGGSWNYQKVNDPTIVPAGAFQSPAQGGGYGAQGYYVDDNYTSLVSHPTANLRAQYLEDRYQITDRILLDLGLRNEQFTNYNDAGQEVESQRHQLAPRLAAIWDVNGDRSTKIFANLGRYYMPEPSMLVVDESGRIQQTDRYYTYTGVNPATGAPTGLNPISGLVSGDNKFGQVQDPRQSIAENIKPLYQDELSIGFEKAYSAELNFGANFNYSVMRSTQDDFCDQAPIDAWAAAHNINDSSFSFACAVINPGQNNTLLLNLTGSGKLVPVNLTAANIGFPEQAKRTYAAINLFAEHPFRDHWYGKVNYTYSQLKGNSEGQIDSNGGGSVSATALWDMKQIMYNSYGYLPNDHTHVIKAFGYYRLNSEWTVGSNLNLTSGAPRSCYGNLPLSQYTPGDPLPGYYGSSFFYCNGAAVQRGSAGRLPWDTQLSLNVAYEPEVLKGIKFKIDVFNVLDRQTELSENQAYNSGPDTINPFYRMVGNREQPRSARLTAEYNHQF